MPIQYAFDPTDRILHTTVSGFVSLEDVSDYFEKVQREDWFPSPSLTELRELKSDMSSADVRAVASLLHKLGPKLRGAPLAVLVHTDLDFGLVRMIEQLQEDDVAVRAFRDPVDANNWLKQDPTHNS